MAINATEYISTRGNADALDFAGVTLTGLARDGGLYVPRHWPTFSTDQISEMRGLNYVELAAKIMAPFTAGVLDESEIDDTRFVCHGDEGSEGPAGEIGATGTEGAWVATAYLVAKSVCTETSTVSDDFSQAQVKTNACSSASFRSTVHICRREISVMPWVTSGITASALTR